MPPNASQIQQQITGVIYWAWAQGCITSPDAASMEGRLGKLLKPINDFTHHAALLYKEAPAFLATVRACCGDGRNTNKKLIDVKRRELVAKLRAEGMTLKAIAEKIGVKYPRVHKILRTIEEDKHPRQPPRRVVGELLEFLMLTAVRIGQIVGNEVNGNDPSRWSDIDFESKIWICRHHKAHKKRQRSSRSGRGRPAASRMKPGDSENQHASFDQKAHIIPLSRQAIAVFERMRERQTAIDAMAHFSGFTVPKREFVFVNDSIRALKGHPINQATVAVFTRKTLKRPDITRQGMRTTFKTWGGENNYPTTDSEMALAHMNLRGVEGEKVLLTKGTRMYERMIERIEPRRRMLQDWADFLDRTEPRPASVHSIQEARSKKTIGKGQ
jgi:integrase